MSDHSQSNFAAKRMALSVVIPLYNKAQDIGRALHSVLEQTHPVVQIVVVDDGSTDGSADAARAVCDGRIEVISQKNAGVSAARNAGIARATQPWIALLDADDQWLDDHVETLSRLQQRFPQCSVLSTSYVIRTLGGGDVLTVLRPPEPMQKESVLPDYFALASRSDPPICSSTVAFTRGAIDAIGGFPSGIAVGEDLLTWARLAARFEVAYSLKRSVIVWQPEFSSGKPTRAPAAEDQVGDMLRQLLSTMPASCRRSLLNYIALWHKMRGSIYLGLGIRGAAREEFVRAFHCGGPTKALCAKTAMTLLPLSVVRRILRRRAQRSVKATQASEAASSGMNQ